MPGNAVYFSSYALLRHLVGGAPPDRSQPRTLWQHLADAGSAIFCGGLAGEPLATAPLLGLQCRHLRCRLPERGHCRPATSPPPVSVLSRLHAGMIMWTLVLPIDLAKTRVQTAYPGERSGEKSGAGAGSHTCETLPRPVCWLTNLPPHPTTGSPHDVGILRQMQRVYQQGVC